MKTIFKYSIIFVIIIIVFNILLLLSSLFPSSWIEENVKESSQRLNYEDNRFIFLDFPPIICIYNNNYSDSIMINESYSIDNTNPVFSYMSARKNYKTNQTVTQKLDPNNELVTFSSNSVDSQDRNIRVYDPVKELSEFLDGKVTTSIEYARYWHGYLFFLRILLIFFNITEIRILLYIIFTLLFFIFLYYIAKKIGIIYSIIFAISLLSVNYFFVPYSLESSPIFLVMMISSIFLLKKIENFKNLYIFFFVISCISNYVDFLTVPLITLAIPLFIYILYKQKNNQITLKECIKTIILSSIVWSIGYGLTWIAKWGLYDLIYHKGLIMSGFSQVLYRTSRINPECDTTIIDTLIKLLVIYLSIISITLCIEIVSILIIYLKNMLEPKKNLNIVIVNLKEYIKNTIPFLIISIYPFLWYLILSNHTIMHYGFVYRHMLIFILGIFICSKKIYIITNRK